MHSVLYEASQGTLYITGVSNAQSMTHEFFLSAKERTDALHFPCFNIMS